MVQPARRCSVLRPTHGGRPGTRGCAVTRPLQPGVSPHLRESPHQYLLTRRLERAVALLTTRASAPRDDLVVLLVDLEPGDARLERDVLPVLRELRPHLTAASFAAVYEEGYAQGLRYLGAFDGDRCIGVAGWRVVATTTAIRKLYVDDLVTLASERGRGVGARLLTELVDRAQAMGCQMLDLDSGVQRGDAHRFYMREGLTISSFHFVRPVG